MQTIEELRKIISEKIPQGLIVPEHTDSAHFYRHVPSGKLFQSVTTHMQGVVASPNLQVWAAKLAVENMVDKLTLNRDLLDDNVGIDELKKQSVRVHRDTFEDAGGIGTVGHKAVEEYNLEWITTGKQPEDIERFLVGKDVRERAILRSAIEFYNDYYYLPVASELLVCNLKDDYAGTLDCLGYIIVPSKRCTTENGRHQFIWNLSSKDWRLKECEVCKLTAKYRLALVDYKTSNHIKQKPTYCAQVSAYSEAFKKMTSISVNLHIIVRLDKTMAKYEAVKLKNVKECYRNFKLMKALSPWIQPSLEHTEPLITKEIIKI